jgi:hypothetical protein
VARWYGTASYGISELFRALRVARWYGTASYGISELFLALRVARWYGSASYGISELFRALRVARWYGTASYGNSELFLALRVARWYGSASYGISELFLALRVARWYGTASYGISELFRALRVARWYCTASCTGCKVYLLSNPNEPRLPCEKAATAVSERRCSSCAAPVSTGPNPSSFKRLGKVYLSRRRGEGKKSATLRRYNTRIKGKNLRRATVVCEPHAILRAGAAGTAPGVVGVADD